MPAETRPRLPETMPVPSLSSTSTVAAAIDISAVRAWPVVSGFISGTEEAVARVAGALRVDNTAAQCGERLQLLVHALEHGVQPPALGLARRPAGVVRPERVDDVWEREPDRLKLAGELDP